MKKTVMLTKLARFTLVFPWALLLILSGTPSFADSEDVEQLMSVEPPELSPAASLSQVVGITEVAITYSRPYVKGRIIWGDLVPYGEVWRTGANWATTFAISTDAMIENQRLPAGEYGLFTIPGEHHWTVIFNRVAKQWGSFRYNADEDALRVDVKPHTAGNFHEQLELSFADVTNDSATIRLRWADLEVPVKLTVDTRKLSTEIAFKIEALKDSDVEGVESKLFSWSVFFAQEGINAEKALEWATKFVEGGRENFWTLQTVARLEHEAGLEQALATAQRAFAAAEKVKGAMQATARREAAAFREEVKGW